MTDQWQKALESAAKRLPPTYEESFGTDGTLSWEEMPEHAKQAARACVLEALSAFSAAGYTLIETVPSDKTLEAMINAQIDAEQTFDDLVGPMEAAHKALITAALKERQT